MTISSAGCQTCKIRRVKCDEATPTCGRCMKSKRVCLRTGSKQPSFSIHLENRYASGQTKRPRGPRSALSHLSNGVHSPILLQPRSDLETQALAYYLHFHLQTLTNVSSVSNGLADCVAIWACGTNCRMVELGISAVALAIFARTHQDSPAAVKASNRYHEVLGVVRQTVETLDETNVDACLLAIFTMCRYEDAVFNLPAGTVPECGSLSHHQGATAVLKLWKDRLSDKMPATEIIKHTRRGLIRGFLLRELPVPDWMQNGHIFGERGRELSFDYLMVQLLNLRYEVFDLMRKQAAKEFPTNEISSRALEIYDELHDIDRALQDWKAHFPRGWTYRNAHLDNDSTEVEDSVSSWTIYSYSCLAHAWIWNQYVSTCMLIDSTRVRILELCQPSSDEYSRKEQLKQCSSRLITMADQLAANIPFCLQRFKIADEQHHEGREADQIQRIPSSEKIKPYIANQLVWPLSIAAGISNLDPKQSAWFKSMLAAIGRVIGLGVIACADSDGWLDL